MKKHFRLTISALAIIVSAVICYPILEKRYEKKEKKKSLDKYYFHALCHKYFTVLNPKSSVYSINDAYSRIEKIEGYMSRDGYNFEQIESMELLAKIEKQDQRLELNWGYEDGASGEEPSELHKDNFYYMYAYGEGKKAIKQ